MSMTKYRSGLLAMQVVSSVYRIKVILIDVDRVKISFIYIVNKTGSKMDP